MTTQFEYPLNQVQLDTFKRDGVLHLPKVLDQDQIERGRDACDRAPATETVEGSRAPEYFMKLRVWEVDDVFKQFCFSSVITGIAAQLTGSDKLNLLYDQMFNIAPGSGDRTVWHNDLPYWPVRGDQVCSIWMAFDRVVKENGALEFIRGSHRWYTKFQPVQTTGDDDIELYESGRDDGHVLAPDFDAERDNYEMLSFDLEPGDALAFHPLMVHSSYPNTSTDLQRRAYAMRFMGREVRYYAGPVWNVYIMNPTLKTGDPLDSEQYPIVYQAQSV